MSALEVRVGVVTGFVARVSGRLVADRVVSSVKRVLLRRVSETE